MLDIKQRQALMERLGRLQKKATSTVSTKVEANNGEFSVVVTADTIDHFYKGDFVGNIKVSSLDDETIELINSDPQEAAQEMLDAFAKSFDTEAFQKKASSNETAAIKEASQDKTAAHETLDDHTWQMTTQKQMDEQKPSLHPRTDDYPRHITQRQIPEDGQRPGTYEIITEGQFRDETTTFYNKPLEGGKRILEDRNIVTEGQFDDGTKEYSEHGQSERAEMGSKFDGDLVKQHKMIGEKQLAELLKHHEWTEPLTITEGKDQLAQQDGELGRLTAEVAEKIVKEALAAMANTVLSAGVTPANLVSVIQRLTSHPSKYPVLADTLKHYADHDISAIHEKVAKAKYFGKTANANREWSKELIADVLVRQLSKMSYNPRFIVEGLTALSQSENIAKRIDETATAILEGKSSTDVEPSNTEVFSHVIKGDHEKPTMEGSAEKDGLYEYTGSIDEVKVATENKDEFIKAAAEYAKEVIKAETDKDIELNPLTIDVNEESGKFRIQLKDASFEKNTEELQTRAENRRKMTKEAQVPAGGMPPAGGPAMGNPMAPPGGADMGAAPPGEAFSQEPPLDEEGELGGEMGGEPKPPGSLCGVCGSEDVDVDNGEIRCNSCGAEGSIHVRTDWHKWPETIQESGAEEEAGFGLGAEEEQMPDELGLGGEPAPGGEGEGTTMPNVPIGASVRITPLLLEKMAEQKIDFGTVCPNCGGHNTDLFKSAKNKGQNGICYDCLQEYNFQVKANPKKAHNVFAQFIWMPKVAESCSTCGRLRTAFTKSLNDYGMRTEDFDKMSMKDKADTVIKMAQTGTLSLEAGMKSPLPMDKYAATFKQKFDKFPSASCRERISRKFGENATAMSGPCQGKPLADCICQQLEGLGIYTDGLAAKVAHVLSSDDPMIHNPSETCVKMLINDNYGVKEAVTACDGLRASAATDEELIIEAIAQYNPFQPKPKPKPMPAPTEGMESLPPKKPMRAPPMGAPPMGAPPAPMGGPMDAAKPMAAPMEAPPAPMQAPPAPMQAPPAPMEAPMGAPAPMEAPMGAPAPMEAPMGAPGMEAPMEAPGMPGEKPMGMSPSPMDEPVMEGLPGEEGLGEGLPGEGLPGEEGALDIEMEGDFGDTDLMGDEDLKTIIIEGLQSIIDALQGNITDDMIDTTGDEELDVGDITEDTVDEEIPVEEGIGESSVEEEIPGVLNEEDEGSEDLEKEGQPEEEMAAPMKEKAIEEKSMISEEAKPLRTIEEKPMIKEKKVLPIAAEEEVDLKKEASVNDLDKMLYHMKQGTISRSASSLDHLIEGLVANDNFIKTAIKTDGDVKKMTRSEASESKVTEKPAQEAPEIGQIKNDKTMGHEEKLALTGPDVPRGDATIGDEDADVKVNDGDRPTVPHGSPAMAGEEHYRPEKGNVADGNQGGAPMTSASESKEEIKTADEIKEAKCKKCSKPMAKCMCSKAESKAETKTAACQCKPDCQCGGPGKCKGDCSCQTIAEEKTKIKKESQTVSPKSVEKLEDDPDINPSSGPGAGKTHADEAHSLGIDEKKPTEGVSDPEVPEAPDSGQLKREHTYDNKLEGPEIPAGGGMNPDYDENEKNEPEKLDQTLGKENDIAAMAESNRERATKIAGQMLKAQKITIDELPDKIAELSKAGSAILDDYEAMMKEASTKKGLQKEAGVGSLETSFQLNTPMNPNQEGELKDSIQSMFRLDQRNRDYEKHTNENRLW